ncbi:MAG: VanZ family protein [Candidatus Aminicenantales bacterium]
MSKFRAFLPAFLYYVLITIISAQTRLRVPSYFPYIDKVLHFVLYAGFGVCLTWGFFRMDPRRGRKGLGFILVLGAFLSGLDEIHQLFVPGRFAEVADWIVDVLGILAGWGIVRLAFRLRPTRSSRR